MARFSYVILGNKLINLETTIVHKNSKKLDHKDLDLEGLIIGTNIYNFSEC